MLWLLRQMKRYHQINYPSIISNFHLRFGGEILTLINTVFGEFTEELKQAIMKNTFEFNDGTQLVSLEDVSRFQQCQYGLTLSVGYNTFTAHMYYGLTPILKDSSIGTTEISTKIVRIGLIFYLL